MSLRIVIEKLPAHLLNLSSKPPVNGVSDTVPTKFDCGLCAKSFSNVNIQDHMKDIHSIEIIGNKLTSEDKYQQYD